MEPHTDRIALGASHYHFRDTSGNRVINPWAAAACQLPPVARTCGRRHFYGPLAKNLGDGLLIYFGWPTAREDDPERSVRAGLAIVEAMRALKNPPGSPFFKGGGEPVPLFFKGGAQGVPPFEKGGRGGISSNAAVTHAPELAGKLRPILQGLTSP